MRRTLAISLLVFSVPVLAEELRFQRPPELMIAADTRAAVSAAAVKSAVDLPKLAALVSLPNGVLTGGQADYARFLQTASSDKIPIESVVASFMLLAVQNVENQLTEMAARVQKNIELAEAIRAELVRLQAILAAEGAPARRGFTLHPTTAAALKLDPATVYTTRNQIEEYRARLEELLKTVTDMSEMDKFDLQKKYQEYQQGVSTLSTILKQMTDTAKAILANLRA